MSPNDKIIRLPEVKATVGLSTATIYRLIRAGDFPAPIKLGKNSSGWIAADVQAWIMRRAGREAANDSQPQAA